MKRSTLNYIVDIATLLLILAMVCTGLILAFVLLPGTGGREGGAASVLWGWARHDWGDLHFWIAVGLAVILVLHVALHWNWVCGITRHLLGRTNSSLNPSHVKQNLAGIGFLASLVILLGGFTLIARVSVEQREPMGERHRGGQLASQVDQQDRAAAGRSSQQLIQVRGSMTLGELADESGVPLSTLQARLNLPDDVSPDEQLGRLRRQYGFAMSDARRAAGDPTPTDHDSEEVEP